MFESPFHWWVQSVMPVVFDESLSYYEVLAKLTKYIEGLSGDVKEIEAVLDTIEDIGDVEQFTRFLESIQAQIGNLANLETVNKNTLVSAINEGNGYPLLYSCLENSMDRGHCRAIVHGVTKSQT